jgi:hypothetical protein
LQVGREQVFAFVGQRGCVGDAIEGNHAVVTDEDDVPDVGIAEQRSLDHVLIDGFRYFVALVRVAGIRVP